jgi:hypothetical protein
VTMLDVSEETNDFLDQLTNPDFPRSQIPYISDYLGATTLTADQPSLLEEQTATLVNVDATTPDTNANSHTRPPLSFQGSTKYFVLDSSGNDLSGLVTYTEIPLPANYPAYDSRTGERFHYVVPQQMVIRVSSSRLLLVGHLTGDVVQQHTNICKATVLRRFVAGGTRKYDLKDELGCVWKDVSETELEDPWEGFGSRIFEEGDFDDPVGNGGPSVGARPSLT